MAVLAAGLGGSEGLGIEAWGRIEAWGSVALMEFLRGWDRGCVAGKIDSSAYISVCFRMWDSAKGLVDVESMVWSTSV